ncbi:MAG: AAA family ATPase, partial [Fibrobacterota bacterium]
MENFGDKNIIPVGAGKGGVGKTSLTASLGYIGAGSGRKVTIVDSDLGTANLHLLTGVNYPSLTINDMFSGRKLKMKDIVLETPFERLFLVSGANDILSLANPSYSRKMKLIRNLRKIDSDDIFVDIA